MRWKTVHLGKKARIAATIKIFTSAISKKKSQPSRISWSQRKRGSVQRTHENKNHDSNFCEKDCDVDEAENPPPGPVRNSREMPASEEQRDDDCRSGNHRGVFAEKIQGEFHRAIFDV